jgi:hypothetical protein
VTNHQGADATTRRLFVFSECALSASLDRMRYRTPHGQTYGQLYGLGAGQAYHPHHRCPPGTVQQCRPATADEIAAKQAALDARAAALATGDYRAQHMSTGDDRISGDRFCECVPAPAGTTPVEVVPAEVTPTLPPMSPVRTPERSTPTGWIVAAVVGVGALGLGLGLALRR